MDTTTKSSISLEQVLMSYKVMLILFSVFIIIMLLLMMKNKKGFNKAFGYEIFITGPIILLVAFLIKELFQFKQDPSKSIFYSFPESSSKLFLPIISLLILFIGISGFFMMLYVGGVFSDNPPENNTAMILNFIIIISFIIIALVIYKKYQNKDDNTLKSFPKAVQDAFNLRTKYTFLFASFVLLIMILYFVNPWGIMTDYGGPVIFFTLFVGIVMVIMITLYQTFLANPPLGKANALNDTPGPLPFIMKGLYVLTSIGISFGLIYGALKMMGVFNQDASNPETWGHIIFNLVLFSAMLSVIYKLANAGGFLDKNPYYRLVLNTLLYIPCLLVTIMNYISQLLGFSKTPGSAFTPPNSFELKILTGSLVLLGGYFLWIFLGKHFVQSVYLKQGGQQLINQPVPTDVLTNVSSYQNLSGSDKFNYQYAMSFWVYLDAFPPSTNASYGKVVPILSYGENPTIKYSSENNTLYITVKQKTDTNSIVDFVKEKEVEINPETIDKWKNVQDKIDDTIEKVKSMPFGNEIDADGHRIIYKHSDVKLQKWNHILLNYNGGTLDVFYNGKLVKSAIEVVPYMKLDMLTVGIENGVSGNIANLMYFKHPLDYLTVNTLYNSLRTENPPVIPNNNEKLIPL